MSTVERIRERYHRKSSMFPEGAVQHLEDCEVHGTGVCACGLLHDLRGVGYDERVVHDTILAQRVRHDRALSLLRVVRLP